MADIRKLTEHLSVAPQLVASDLEAVASQGFKSVLCNRPDHEEVTQPTYREVQSAIEEQGLASEFQPVNGSIISDEDVDAFAEYIDSMIAPVLAYCRSGTRCTVLWALSEAGKRPIDEVLSITAQAGYSLDALRPRLEARARTT